jgi:DNA-binding MarR family transcriptional regulator
METTAVETAEITAASACQNLLALVKHLKAAMAGLAEEYNLTSIQLYALYAIKEAGATGMAMGRLAQTMHCDASNITGIVDRLAALSLIVRQEDGHDRRVKKLLLTEQGERIFGIIEAELPARMGCDLLSQQERLELRGLTLKLNVTLPEYAPPA